MERDLDREQRERIARLATECVCSNLRRASRAATNYYDHLLERVSDLRVSQVTVLCVLYLAGPQTIQALADLLALDRTTVGRNLRPLAQQKLLTFASGDDRRTRVVRLTAEGEAAFLRVVPQWEQAQANLVGGLGRQRVEALLAQLSAVTAETRTV